MQKKHGITVALASLSAATASIVAGALVSQHAVADSDTAPKATVTVVTGGSDGSGAYSCTFDDLTLPEPGSMAGFGTGGAAGGTSVDGTSTAAGAFRVRGDGPPAGSPGLVVRGSARGAAEGDGGAGPAPFVTSFSTGSAPDGAGLPARPVELGEAREGTPEECAAVRADLPGAVASAVPAPATAESGGN